MPTISSAARRSGLTACSASTISREAMLSACRRRGRQRLGIVERQHDDLGTAPGLAHLVDEQMMHDGEQPAPRAFARLPVVQPEQRPLETVLDQIVRRVGVAQKGARIAPETRHFGKDRCLPVVHVGPSVTSRRVAAIEAPFALQHKPKSRARRAALPAGTRSGHVKTWQSAARSMNARQVPLFPLARCIN